MRIRQISECPHCGGSRLREVSPRHVEHPCLYEDLVACLNCGLVFLEHLPTEKPPIQCEHKYRQPLDYSGYSEDEQQEGGGA